jgi:hypothetical protein
MDLNIRNKPGIEQDDQIVEHGNLESLTLNLLIISKVAEVQQQRKSTGHARKTGKSLWRDVRASASSFASRLALISCQSQIV